VPEQGGPAPEELLATALEQLDVAVCIADARLPDAPLVWVNAAFERATGYPPEQALGRNCRFLQGDLPPQPQVAVLRAAIAAAQPVTVVVLNVRADGSTFSNEVTVTPLHDDAGTLTHFLALQRDVSVAAQAQADRRALARRMQGDLVPADLPAVPGLDVAVRYEPGATTVDGAAVSGDFYDLYATSSAVGAAATWNAAIGDVEGRGEGAAAYTATVRNLLKGLALDRDSPARSLSLLNSALLDQLGDRFVTVALTRLQVRQDRVRATVALGGHPQPVARTDGQASLVGAPGDLLGVLPQAEVTDSRTDLAPGDLLVLYTDGITEAGRADDQFGEDRLLEVVDGAPGGAEEVADAVLDAVRAHSGRSEDDAALLVVRVDEP
jgi:PAS domain S-box-containing protein